MESYGRKRRDIGATEPYVEATTSSSFIANISNTEHVSTKPTTYNEMKFMNLSKTSSLTKITHPAAQSTFSKVSRIENTTSSSITQVFGVFRVINTTRTPFVRKLPPVIQQNNWWAPQALNDNYGNRDVRNHPGTFNSSVISSGQQGSRDDGTHRWRYHTADGIDNSNVHKISIHKNDRNRNNTTNERPRTRVETDHNSGYKNPSNYVTPSRYRPGFTNVKQINRFINTFNQSSPHQQRTPYAPSRVEHNPKEVSRKMNKMHNLPPSHRRSEPNRYYAYNTNASRQNVSFSRNRWPTNYSPDDVQSSLTTPELIISTMVPVPDELPLSLAIMVGEDPGVDVSSWKSNTKNGKQMGKLFY